MADSPTQVVELAVNLDDTTAEVLGDAVQRLLEQGALDVWTQPIAMKKNRPAVMLCLLCESSVCERMAELILELTGSFGVRYRTWDRLVLERRHVMLDSALGSFRAKVGSLDEKIIVAQPEFDDIQTQASEHGVPLRQAMTKAQAAVQQWLDQQQAQ